jgi:hypothetical protein
VEYLRHRYLSLKADIENLTSFLAQLIEDQCLPNRKLKLEMWSESEMGSGPHTSMSLGELFEYSSEGDYMSFLTDWGLSELSPPSTAASSHSPTDIERAKDGVARSPDP